MIYDVQLGVWVYFKYPEAIKKETRNFQLKRGYFPYNFNFVRGHRGDLAQCSYCGKFLPMKEMTRDHIWPKSLGGVMTTTACGHCNTIKKNMKPIEFGLWFDENASLVSSG